MHFHTQNIAQTPAAEEWRAASPPAVAARVGPVKMRALRIASLCPERLVGVASTDTGTVFVPWASAGQLVDVQLLK
jgi:hypothetical protein